MILAQLQGFQYCWFWEHYRTWAGKVDVVMRQERRVGEKVFVDYAGQKVPIIDWCTGEIPKFQGPSGFPCARPIRRPCHSLPCSQCVSFGARVLFNSAASQG